VTLHKGHGLLTVHVCVVGEQERNDKQLEMLVAAREACRADDAKTSLLPAEVSMSQPGQPA
jgi:hypothetical protein